MPILLKRLKQKDVEWRKARQELNRKWKEELIDDVRKAGILIDYDVTPDPRRIIRLPGTVHGKTLRLCKIIKHSDLIFNEDREVIGYNPDDPIG